MHLELIRELEVQRCETAQLFGEARAEAAALREENARLREENARLRAPFAAVGLGGAM